MRVIPLIAVTVFLGTSAFATSPQVREFDTGGIIVSDRQEARPGADGQGEPGRQVYGYWFVAWAEGGFCRDRRYTYDPDEARSYQYAYNRQVADANGLVHLPECPKEARPAPALPSPGDLARQFWDVRHLPSPTLEVVPDYAITGKRVYLTIHGPPTAEFEVPNPIGNAVSIRATSRYVVDWGDGTPPTTTTSRGGRWPDGDLTHVYDTTATRTITVAQQWSATWTAGPGTGGALDNLRTSGSLTLPVRQVQAVRNR